MAKGGQGSRRERARQREDGMRGRKFGGIESRSRERERRQKEQE